MIKIDRWSDSAGKKKGYRRSDNIKVEFKSEVRQYMTHDNGSQTIE